jgi:hypothetical protein
MFACEQHVLAYPRPNLPLDKDKSRLA